jgi:hypothetical protein
VPFQSAERTRISLSFPHFSQLNSYIGIIKVYSRNRLFQARQIALNAEFRAKDAKVLKDWTEFTELTEFLAASERKGPIDFSLSRVKKDFVAQFSCVGCARCNERG